MLDWLPAIVRLIARWWPPNCSIQGVRHRRRADEGKEVQVAAELPRHRRRHGPPRRAATTAARLPYPQGLVTTHDLGDLAQPVLAERRCEERVHGSALRRRQVSQKQAFALKDADGRLDHLVFCGPSKGNWTLALPASSSVATTACAAATMRAVVSEAVPAGLAPRCANPTAATAKHKPNERVETIRTGCTHVGILA